MTDTLCWKRGWAQINQSINQPIILTDTSLQSVISNPLVKTTLYTGHVILSQSPKFVDEVVLVIKTNLLYSLLNGYYMLHLIFMFEKVSPKI